MSAQTAFATDSLHILKCCNPIGQFERLPAAPVGFVFLSNQVDVDLPQAVETIPGKFHRNRLYGVEMHSEQTNRQTDTLLYILLAEVPDDECRCHLLVFLMQRTLI